GEGGVGGGVRGGEVALHVLRSDHDVVVGDDASGRAAGGGDVVGTGGKRQAVPAAGPRAGRADGDVVAGAPGGDGHAGQTFAGRVEIILAYQRIVVRDAGEEDAAARGGEILGAHERVVALEIPDDDAGADLAE